MQMQPVGDEQQQVEQRQQHSDDRVNRRQMVMNKCAKEVSDINWVSVCARINDCKHISAVWSCVARVLQNGNNNNNNKTQISLYIYFPCAPIHTEPLPALNAQCALYTPRIVGKS